MGQSLEERLRRLEDILAIQQLFIDYGLALDAGDFDRYAQLFAVQGTVNLGPIGRATGRSEIQALMVQTLEGLVGSSFHIVSNPQINLHGDIATSQVMWTVIHRDKNGQPQVTMIGKHHDELIRENGEWKIQTRKGTVDIPAKYQTPKI
jgi:3-phenylpropionate/cinnamic acid dioxygenase small subunit